MASKIDLISGALVLIGDTTLNSLDDNTRQANVANSLYDDIVQDELTKHRWGFARRKAQLNLLVAEPIDDEWQSIYQLPTDLLVLIKLNPRSDYNVYGDQIYTNLSQDLWIDYIKNVAESEWPVYFSKTIKYALAKDFATSIRDSAASRIEMSNEYVISSRMARYTDSQQHPQKPIVSRPFIDVRF